MPDEIPIKTSHLFALLDKKLIELLRSLSAAEWSQPTIAKLWTVKDIAAHLLDGNIRTLSMARDGYFGVSPCDIHSYQKLLDYLNKLNADWVHALKRLSPLVLTDMLETTCKEFSAYITTLDPFEPAIFSVAWAGQEQSPNWFHTAREYTEKWVHQQQIRDALNRPGIMGREFFYPFIQTFLQALPYTYRNTNAIKGTSVLVIIKGELGGQWLLVKSDDQWQFANEKMDSPNVTVELDADTAWKLFSKGISPETALESANIYGDENLGKVALNMISVLA